jgi:predicted nucleic acid-binding protein
MRMVIDASIVIAVVVDEPERDKILEMTIDAEFVSPRSLPWEVGNALSAMLKRRRLDLGEVVQAWRLFDQIDLRRLAISSEAALRLAAELNIYAYDAYMIQCARSTGSELFTLDRGLQRAARQAGVAVLEVKP